jgi:hypothetical protein
MFRKHLAIVVAVSLSLLLIQPPALAQSRGEGAPTAEKIKADVAAIGTGARVSVKLREGRSLTGYVSQVGEQDFVLTKAKEGTKQTVAYADVTRVKVKNEKRISTAGRVLIVLTLLSLVGGLANSH